MRTRREMLAVAGCAAAAPAFAADATGKPAALPVWDAFAGRQTVRKYKMDPVPDSHVTAILEAARMPPTTMNQQPWKFLVVRDRAKIEAMRKMTMERMEKAFADFVAKNPDKPKEAVLEQKRKATEMTEGYFTAPVYIVVLVDTECPYKEYALQHDGPLAAGYLMLAARALGYGTVYLTDGVPDEVSKAVLKIPERYRRICMTPIGVPDGWPEKKPKKRLEELVAYETL